MSSCKGRGEPIERGEMYSLSLGKHRMWLTTPHTNGDWLMPIACLLGALPLKPQRRYAIQIHIVFTLSNFRR